MNQAKALSIDTGAKLEQPCAFRSPGKPFVQDRTTTFQSRRIATPSNSSYEQKFSRQPAAGILLHSLLRRDGSRHVVRPPSGSTSVINTEKPFPATSIGLVLNSLLHTHNSDFDSESERESMRSTCSTPDYFSHPGSRSSSPGYLGGSEARSRGTPLGTSEAGDDVNGLQEHVGDDEEDAHEAGEMTPVPPVLLTPTTPTGPPAATASVTVERAKGSVTFIYPSSRAQRVGFHDMTPPPSPDRTSEDNDLQAAKEQSMFTSSAQQGDSPPRCATDMVLGCDLHRWQSGHKDGKETASTIPSTRSVKFAVVSQPPPPSPQIPSILAPWVEKLRLRARSTVECVEWGRKLQVPSMEVRRRVQQGQETAVVVVIVGGNGRKEVTVGRGPEMVVQQCLQGGVGRVWLIADRGEEIGDEQQLLHVERVALDNVNECISVAPPLQTHIASGRLTLHTNIKLTSMTARRGSNGYNLTITTEPSLPELSASFVCHIYFIRNDSRCIRPEALVQLSSPLAFTSPIVSEMLPKTGTETETETAAVRTKIVPPAKEMVRRCYEKWDTGVDLDIDDAHDVLKCGQVEFVEHIEEAVCLA